MASAFATSVLYCARVSALFDKRMKRNKRDADYKGRSKTVFIHR